MSQLDLVNVFFLQAFPSILSLFSVFNIEICFDRRIHNFLEAKSIEKRLTGKRSMSQTLSLVCCLKAATAQEVLCYGLTRPLSFCSSPSILFRLAMLRSGNKQSFRYFRRVVFEKVPMFKYFNFFGKLACENIFIFAHNSKQ